MNISVLTVDVRDYAKGSFRAIDDSPYGGGTGLIVRVDTMHAALTITDSVVRLILGILKEGVTDNESFENSLLEYSQYTHPEEYEGDRVPDVLLSGNGTSDRLKKYEMTADEKEAQETADEVTRTVAERFRFSMCGLTEGETIEFCYDPSITCTVYDDTHVLFENEVYSLTALAKKLTNNENGNIAGPRYFKYKGEWLNTLRQKNGNK